MLRQDWEYWVCAAEGLVISCWRRRIGVLIPSFLLATAFAEHHLHRPFWHYYYVHLSIPLCWLAAIGVRKPARWARERLRVWQTGGGLKGLVFVYSLFAFLGALALGPIPIRLDKEVDRIRRPKLVSANEVVRALRSRASATQRVFSDPAVYAFHTRLPVPPELVVIPQKRLRSDMFDPADLIAALERYRPEQIVRTSLFRKSEAVGV